MTNTLTEPTETRGMLRPNAKRAKNAITLLWIILILEFVSIFLDYLQYALLSSPEISEEAANTNDTRQQIFGVTYLICFIVSAVMFIRWFRRAYYNLSQKDEYLSHSNKDTGICWFLPVINLYKPYQIMKEMYRNTGYLLEDHHPETKEKLSLNIITFWWILWIVNNVLGQVSFRMSRNIDSIEDIFSVTTLGIVTSLIGIPLALLAIEIVRRYAKAEAVLAEIPDENNELDNIPALL
ncbi:DUF4328 domain-containing protein [Sphingobacterium chuzhouense]|uniref:DUF4328 domain-containing protein n=1 Tax=Sphingobacterium chuzhouense TaxID=1742264 RepID=A0ABR7XR64_9SPHI|nr:DUF4328 domain-containing protein [Sphingobacterium chuzhouense]MBD1421647.1 DUF4328 domain-containing protein [Sphingobacterium chuzhouense]